MHTKTSGQATVEFLVALLVMVPLFFGTYYFARYADVKHSAIQASRYVAFERALDPRGGKSPAVLAEETRARFFTPVSLNDGEISFHQTTAQLSADRDRVPLWSDATYQPLLQRFSDVAIREAPAGAMSAGVVGQLQNTAGKVFSLPTGGMVRAEVTVPLNNVAHFEVLRNINVGMPGATAIQAGTWSASGAKNGAENVCDRVKPTVLGRYIKPAMVVLGVLMSPFERHTPDVGIVLPDYVPPGSVDDTAKASVPYNRQDGNKC